MMLCHQQKRGESVLVTGEARQYQGIQNSSITTTNDIGMYSADRDDCYFLNTNWFNLAVEILKDLLRSSLATLEKLTIRCGAPLTQTFQVDSGITGFNVLANLNISDTVFSSTDATGSSYIHYQAVLLKLLMVLVH